MVLTLREKVVLHVDKLPDAFPERWNATLFSTLVTASSLDELKSRATTVWEESKHEYPFNAVLLTDITLPKSQGELYSGMSCGYFLDHRRRGFDMTS